MASSTIDCFLLAAGESSRMFPLSQIMEKSLLPVDGKPVIRIIVENLLKPRVVEHLGKIHIICLSKFRKQFEHEFRDMPSIEIIDMPKPIGTFSTFFAFTPVWDKPSEYVMVHYADCITDIDYVDFISKIDPKYNGLIAVTNTVKHDYSEVSFTVDGVVQDFVEKPNVMNYSWSGIGIFHTESLHLQYKRKGEGDDFAFDIFPQMIIHQELKAYPYNGYWYDCGNLNSYRKVCEMYSNSKPPV